jgi:DNA-binding PadR family transcriptional regulator
VTAARIRVSMVILDILEAIDRAPAGDPSWGRRLCEQTGHAPGTVYPALDKLMKAGWITGRWEEPQPADRPRRRFHILTEDGRDAYREALAERETRRAAWGVLASFSPGAC